MALVPPKIEKLDGHFAFDIGRDVQNSIKKFNPYFTSWFELDFMAAVREKYKATADQTLAGVVADFNGDKIPDAAIFGHDQESNLLLVALSTPNGYQIVEIDRAPITNPAKNWVEGPKSDQKGLWIFLSYVRPIYLQSKFEKAPIHLKYEAFQENYFEKGSVVHYFKDGQFHKYTLAE